MGYSRFLQFKNLGVVAAGVCLAMTLYGQEEPKSTDFRASRSREVVQVLNEARLAAPELTVDTFLKAIEVGKIQDPKWKKEVLDEALRVVDDVRNPVQLWPVMVKGVLPNNNEAFVIGLAHRANLDRLNLFSRIVSAMLTVDPERAKLLLLTEGNGQLRLKRRTCQDNLTYEVGSIYAAVGKVAKSVFNEKDVAEGRRAVFIAPWIENLESPRQVEPVIDLIFDLKGPPVERQMLLAALSRAINRNFQDDRSFTSSVIPINSTLAKRMRSVASGSAPDNLLDGILSQYREFLVKNLRGSRCRDNEISKAGPIPAYIEEANRLFAQKPLSGEDLIAFDFENTGSFPDVFARSASARELGNQLRPLQGKVVEGKVVLFSDPQWQAKVLEFIDKVATWEGSDNETEIETLMVKATMFDVLVRSIDLPDLKRIVIRKFITYLSSSSLQKRDFPVWHMYVAGIQRSNPDLFAEIVQDFPNANLSVMVMRKKQGL